MKSDHVPGNAFSMEKEQIRKLGYEIVDIITDELDDPARRPIYPRPYDWDELEPVLGGDAPEYGQDPHELLRVVRDTLIPASANYIHPRLLGYVSSTPLPMTGLIEALVASIRLFPYTWNMTPGSSFIEATVARWLGQMVGYSDTAAGYMTTGGSWANLMGIAVARVRKAGWDIKADGMTGHPALIAYTANQAHSCHEQIIKLLGLGERQLRKIPVDSRFRIDLRALEATIRADLESGLKPFCVIANAGTTNTGAVDPLNAIADLAEAFDLWFHIDGAYGAFAAMDPDTSPVFKGIERADSLVVDPHKWLNIPYDAGCVLMHEWRDMSDTFSILPAYLEGGHDASHHDHWQHGFELTRTDRALKVWVAIRQYGVARFREMVTNHIALSRRVGQWVEQSPDFELTCEPSLSVCCFRYRPTEVGGGDNAQAYLNQLNGELENALASDGRALMTGTELNGHKVLRTCIVNHKATWQGVEQTLELIRELGEKLHNRYSMGS